VRVRVWGSGCWGEYVGSAPLWRFRPCVRVSRDGLGFYCVGVRFVWAVVVNVLGAHGDRDFKPAQVSHQTVSD
jgi:hypothetical protein